MSRDLIERLRRGAVLYEVRTGQPIYAGPTALEREAADRIAALEAEIEEMTTKFVAYEYLVSPAGEEIALEENARLRARIAALEASESEGERLRAALIALRGFMPPAGDDRVDEALRLADAALIPAPAREGE